MKRPGFASSFSSQMRRVDLPLISGRRSMKHHSHRAGSRPGAGGRSTSTRIFSPNCAPIQFLRAFRIFASAVIAKRPLPVPSTGRVSDIFGAVLQFFKHASALVPPMTNSIGSACRRPTLIFSMRISGSSDWSSALVSWKSRSVRRAPPWTIRKLLFVPSTHKYHLRGKVVRNSLLVMSSGTSAIAQIFPV